MKWYKKIATLCMVFCLTVSSSIMSLAGTWVQDSTKWKVQADDGTYLTNQWYQSPTSDLWYYIGADGYMLVNTTTPDGYYVNADGVWTETVQTQPQTQPQVQPTQSQQQTQLTPQEQAELEELNRLIEERGKKQTHTDVGANGGHAGYDDSDYGDVHIGG